MAAVLEAFAAERLLTLAADSVEVSHEVLLTAWPLLRDTWLAETHADRIVRTRLRAVAGEWARHSRDPSYLYGGSLLEAATTAAARTRADPARNPPLSPAERDFLHASERAHRRSVRRRQRFIAFLVVLVIGLASVAVLAFHNSQVAIDQRNVADSDQLAAQSEILGNTDPALSRLESLAAWRISPTSAARYAMLAAAARPGIAVLNGGTGAVTAVAFSPDGRTLASTSDDGTARLWDVATRQQIGQPMTTNDRSVSLAFSPDSMTLATVGEVTGVQLWDVATRHKSGGPLGDKPYARADSVAFSGDGKTLAIGGDGVRLWDVATRRQIGTPLASGPVILVAFSADGKTLAIATDDGTVRLWDVATRRQIGSPLAVGRAVGAVAFSADGTTLASGSTNGTVRLWDVATRRQIGVTLTGHIGPVHAVAFSPDGKTLASGSDDHTVRLWDVVSADVATLTGHADSVNSVVFSPNGKTLASGSDDHTVRLWDVATGGQIGIPLLGRTGHPGGIYSVAFSPDGKTLATGSASALPEFVNGNGIPLPQFNPNAYGAVRLWDLATRRETGTPLIGQPVFTPEGPLVGPVYSVAFSPDGKTLAIGGSTSTGLLQLIDLATRRPIGPNLVNTAGPVNSVAFSPDGKTLASGNGDGTVQLWDMATRTIIATLAGHTASVYSVAFSPDGKTLASGSADGTVRLWDVATDQQIGDPLAAQAGPVHSVAFSPDGKTLASGNGRRHSSAVGRGLPCAHRGGSVRPGRTPAHARRVDTIRPAGPGVSEHLPLTADLAIS